VWDLDEFYDMQSDPQEQHNLIMVPAFQDEIRRTRDRLWDQLEATGGMKIPLRRSTEWQAAERKLHE